MFIEGLIERSLLRHSGGFETAVIWNFFFSALPLGIVGSIATGGQEAVTEI